MPKEELPIPVPNTGSRFDSTDPPPEVHPVVTLLRQQIEGSTKKISLRKTIGFDTEYHKFPPIPPEVTHVLEIIRIWCINRGIWSTKSDEQGRAYTSMVAHLHVPFSFAERPIELSEYLSRLTLAGKLYSWLFYLDDALGNDVQQKLSEDSKKTVIRCMQFVFPFLKEKITFDECKILLTGLKNELKNQKEAQELQSIDEQLTIVHQVMTAFEVYQEIISEFEQVVLKDAAADSVSPDLPMQWLETMKTAIREHLLAALTNQDDHPVVTIWEYILVRRKVSGMVPAIYLIRFIMKCYQDTSENSPLSLSIHFNEVSLQRLSVCESVRARVTLPAFRGVDEKLCPPISSQLMIRETSELLELACIDYGGLVNDLVSLYKELLEKSVFNLVAITYLFTDSNTALHFIDIITQIGSMMCLLLEHATALKEQIVATVENRIIEPTASVREKNLLIREKYFATGLYYAILATFYWQTSPEARARYQASAERIYTEFNDAPNTLNG